MNPKSIQQKLKDIAQKEGKTFQLILIRYLQERLLYRLSISEFKDKFYLKGGVFFYALYGHKSRPTKDIDFLGKNMENDPEGIKAIFQKICQQTPKNDDGVSFEIEKIQSENINETKNYPGVRIKIPALLGNVKETLQIDIGFGDIISPEAQTLSYPILLEGFDELTIQSYSIESAIAEKFEAMISLGQLNSRMKDFYDVYQFLQSRDFEETKLQQAIESTFKRRKTPKIENPVIFEDSFAQNQDKQKQWQSFLKKQKLESEESFEKVMKIIQINLEGFYQKILKKKEDNESI
jgi:predicted nucleotidyltransferase component of viral defense system